jgi:hypothetical protein
MVGAGRAVAAEKARGSASRRGSGRDCGTGNGGGTGGVDGVIENMVSTGAGAVVPQQKREPGRNAWWWKARYYKRGGSIQKPS